MRRALWHNGRVIVACRDKVGIVSLAGIASIRIFIRATCFMVPAELGPVILVDLLWRTDIRPWPSWCRGLAADRDFEARFIDTRSATAKRGLADRNHVPKSIFWRRNTASETPFGRLPILTRIYSSFRLSLTNLCDYSHVAVND